MALTVHSVLGAGPVNNVNGRQTDNAGLRSEIEFRQSLGFRSDPDYIRAVHASRDAVGFMGMGAKFTPTEAEELRVRTDLEHDGETLHRHFMGDSNLRGAFGGIYLDHQAGGQLVLQLVHDHALNEQIPSMLPHLQHPDRLRVEDVEWPEQRLQQQFDTLSDAAVSSRYPELQAIAIDQVTNRVVVLIQPTTVSGAMGGEVPKNALPAAIATLLADPSVVVREGQVLDVPTQGGAMMAGYGWGVTTGSTSCTLGFEVVRNGNPSMLTAGHCVNSIAAGTTIYNFSTAIGTFSGDYQDGAVSNSGYGIDVGIHRMTNAATATDNIHQGGNPSLDVTGALGSSDYFIGAIRCFRGKNSGTICGSTTRASLTYQSPLNQRWYRDMFTIDPVTQEGDSGGPVYRDNNNGTAAAAGIVRGYINIANVTTNNDGVFSKWYNAANLFGLTLVTTD
jgi:hypothetical protein